MAFSLDEKVVIVTGGAGLIGRSFVRAIAQHDGIAIIADIDEIASRRASEELRDELQVTTVDHAVVDITSRDSISVLLDKISNNYGRIDALVNNAYPRNQNYGRKFEDVTYVDFCENISLHLGGYFLMSQQFAAFFRKQGHGNIVNMSSVYGVVAPRFEVYEGTEMTMPVEYAVIKSALIHLTKYLAKYYKGQHIRVNSISPGGVFNSQPESFVTAYSHHGLTKGMLNPQDLHGALIYLLSDASFYVNGQNIIVDDGWSL